MSQNQLPMFNLLNNAQGITKNYENTRRGLHNYENTKKTIRSTTEESKLYDFQSCGEGEKEAKQDINGVCYEGSHDKLYF